MPSLTHTIALATLVASLSFSMTNPAFAVFGREFRGEVGFTVTHGIQSAPDEVGNANHSDETTVTVFDLTLEQEDHLRSLATGTLIQLSASTPPDQAETFEGPFAALVAALATDGRSLGKPGTFERDKTGVLALSFLFYDDPVIYFNLEIENPSDEALNIVIESDQELPDIESSGDVVFDASLSVIDNGGDGAFATASGFGATKDEAFGSLQNTLIPLSDSFPGAYSLSATESSPDSTFVSLEDVQFAANSFPAIGQGLSYDIEVSPGDTAVLEGYFAIGDTNNFLPHPVAAGSIVELLGELNQTTIDFLAIPEPIAAVPVCLALLAAGGRRWRRA